MDDLIRRSDAIRVVSGLDSSFVKYIEEIPSAPSDMTIAYLKGVEDGKDAVRKTGHWKLQTIKGKPLTYCSECGFGKHVDETRRYSYCPNCGAEMRGETNG